MVGFIIQILRSFEQLDEIHFLRLQQILLMNVISPARKSFEKMPSSQVDLTSGPLPLPLFSSFGFFSSSFASLSYGVIG